MAENGILPLKWGSKSAKLLNCLFMGKMEFSLYSGISAQIS